MKNLNLLLAGILLTMAGCTETREESVAASAASVAETQGVWVMKSDGSKSCEPGTAKTLEQDAKDLESKGIRVLEAKKGDDGMMHAQGCGMNTGSTNMFRIPKDQLPQATTQGFKTTQE